MLRGVALSEVRRTISETAVPGGVTLRGSVLVVDLSGAVAPGVASNGVEGASTVGVVGVAGAAPLVEACDGVRETIVGMGVGFGAGRVYTTMLLLIHSKLVM